MSQQTDRTCGDPRRGQTRDGGDHDPYVVLHGGGDIRPHTIGMDSNIGTHAAIIAQTDSRCKPIHCFATTSDGQIASIAGHGAAASAAAGVNMMQKGEHLVRVIGHCVLTGGHWVLTAGHWVLTTGHLVGDVGHVVETTGHCVDSAGHTVCTC